MINDGTCSYFTSFLTQILCSFFKIHPVCYAIGDHILKQSSKRRWLCDIVCTIMLECVFQCYWLLLTDIVCSAEISLRSKMLWMKSLQRNQLCGIIWSPSQMTLSTSGENRKSLKASLVIFDGQNSLSPGWADRTPCCKIPVLISCPFSHLTPVCVCPYQQRNASKSVCCWIFLRLWFRESVHGQLWSLLSDHLKEDGMRK